MAVNTLLFPLGIIPSLLILYLVIGKYEGKFREKNVLITFVAGILIGIVIYLIEGMILYPLVMIKEYLYLNFIIIFSFAFSFLEQMAKLASLNLRRFFDEGTPLYGASFGLGFSSTFAVLLFGKSFEVTKESMSLFLAPFVVILINCSTGILIGIGIKRNLRIKYLLISTIVSVVTWIVLMVSIAYFFVYEYGITLYLSIFAMAYSIFIFVIIYKRYLPYSMLSRRELKKLL
ncbi:MAG: hypothetical protein FE041_05885 [Thermoplasmata archaeon]|nr:MAG: hypothetical protein FE041_05885 [Thermoplasmata archaeon]